MRNNLNFSGNMEMERKEKPVRPLRDRCGSVRNTVNTNDCRQEGTHEKRWTSDRENRFAFGNLFLRQDLNPKSFQNRNWRNLMRIALRMMFFNGNNYINNEDSETKSKRGEKRRDECLEGRERAQPDRSLPAQMK